MAKAPRVKPEAEVVQFILDGRTYTFDAMKLSSADEGDLIAGCGWTIQETMSKIGEGSLVAVQALTFLARRSSGESRATFDSCVVTFGDVTEIEFLTGDAAEDDEPKHPGGD